jgi:hypothetical protein
MLQQERLAQECVCNEETCRTSNSAHQRETCAVRMCQAWLASRAPAVSYGDHRDPTRSQILL